MADADNIPLEIENGSNSSEENSGAEVTSQSLNWFPSTDTSRVILAKSIISQWVLEPDIFSLSLSYNEFKELSDAFEPLVFEKEVITSTSKQDTNDFVALINEACGNVGYLKGYISEEFGKEKYLSRVDEFGLQKNSNGALTIPRSYDLFVLSVKMMITAMQKYNFTTQKFGLKYWTDIYNQAVKFQTITMANSGSRSRISKSKTELRNSIDRGFRIVNKLIEANYFDNPEPILRSWGFVKERIS